MFRASFFLACCGLYLSASVASVAQLVPVDAGSYTLTFPGTDQAGRNGVPPGQPQLSGTAVGRPVPSNDWWSALLNQNHAANLFNYPMGMRTLPRGLDMGYIVAPSGPGGSVQPLSDISPVVVGIETLNATRATVDDYSDWTVDVRWASGQAWMTARMGMGMPMVYFRKSAGTTARIEVNVGVTEISGNRLIIRNSINGATFVVFGPAGTVWASAGQVYTSNLNGKSYWTVAMLPPGTAEAAALAALAPHAHVWPVDTRIDWSYDEFTSVLRVDYVTETEAMEGTETRVIQGILPHQRRWLSGDSATPAEPSYPTIRGRMDLLAGNLFSTERTFHGILPTLPWIPGGSETWDYGVMNEKVAALENEALSTWTDSYNEGQVMNRLVQTARVADLIGRTQSLESMLETVRLRLEDWFTAESGEVAFLFHYTNTWTALLGYPAGHGQDTNLNDHHFHWGYFIHAASFIEQYSPGWSTQWGGMVDLLIRDCANPSREDPLFPFLRNFSPFAGHSWANGFASFPQGNDQESTSESMQFNSSLIHWGGVTGDDDIRDLGIFLYVTEQSAIEEYWLDIHNENLKPEYAYKVVSRVWGNGYDSGTFWTSDIAAVYGIELYPMHGGSLYLGHNLGYAAELWQEMAANTGILSNQANPNLWHDIYWQFLALTDAEAALQLYDSYPDRTLKFGVSDAQTYHWIHAMRALGQVDASLTANHPLATVFSQNGTRTYVAQNYGTNAIDVTYSDGFVLTVPAGKLATSRDLDVDGILSVDSTDLESGQPVQVDVVVTGGTVNRVEFFLNGDLLDTDTSAPYAFTLVDLPEGVHDLHARMYQGDEYAVTNLVVLTVGSQMPFGGQPHALPGTLDAGHYDSFPGASGQGISYLDTTPENSGGFRPGESVDAQVVPSEGAVVGWTASGEWLEYTVRTEQSGIYRVIFRYASGNSQGGGPIRLLVDGRDASGWINVSGTGGWNTFQNKQVEGLAFGVGTQMLRVEFAGGEIDLARMTFEYVEPLSEPLLQAVTGPDLVFAGRQPQVQLNGSMSTAPTGETLSYAWSLVQGPSSLVFSDLHAANPVVTGWVEGSYRLRLTVETGGGATDTAELRVHITPTTGAVPVLAWSEPASATTIPLGQTLSLKVRVQDLDDDLQYVRFFHDGLPIGTAWDDPYDLDWAPRWQGVYQLEAVAVDERGNVSNVRTVEVTVDEPVSCTNAGPNDDFSYAFSDLPDGRSTLTFIPSQSGMGSPTCLLYYNLTGSHPYPGYPVQPGVPFVLQTQPGDTVYFYYTYSHPAGGERTTFGAPVSFTVGNCGESEPVTVAEWLDERRTVYFPPQTLADAGLEATIWGDSADPDADGILNMMELLMGFDPLVRESILDHVVQVDGELLWHIPFLRELPDAPFVVQSSADLQTWISLSSIESSTTLSDNLNFMVLPVTATSTGPIYRLLMTPGFLEEFLIQ